MVMFLKVVIMWGIILVVGTLGPLGASFLWPMNKCPQSDFFGKWLCGFTNITVFAGSLGILCLLYNLSIIFIESFGL